MADGVTVHGIEETKRALDGLVADLRRKVVRAAERDAMRPVVAAARDVAPVLKRPHPRRRPGVLRKAIRVFNSKKANGAGGRLGVYVTVKATRNARRKAPVTGDPYYFRWVESGHRIVPRYKGKYTDYKQRGRGRLTGLNARRRAATGFVPGSPFLLPAYRSKAHQAIAIFTNRIHERIAKANEGK